MWVCIPSVLYYLFFDQRALCRWLLKTLKITRSIASSSFRFSVPLLRTVFLPWFCCQARFYTNILPFIEFLLHPQVLHLLTFLFECNHYYFHFGRGVFSSASKACYGFNYMGVSAYGEEHCWNWAQSTIRDAKKFSGAVFDEFHFYILWCVLFDVLIFCRVAGFRVL